jgi:hypothetical protein
MAGRGGGAGVAPTFVGGPCVVTPDRTNVEVFSRASDGHIYRRAFDGNNWGAWISLAALDATKLDARSDLDCGASADTVHIVATGVVPAGSFQHAFGFGTTYNPFFRELDPKVFGLSPSMTLFNNNEYLLAGFESGVLPALYSVAAGSTTLTPITTLAENLTSAVDIAQQPGGSALTYFVAFDVSGSLAIYSNSRSSGGSLWDQPVRIAPPPASSFAFSPTVCTETGAFGVYSLNVAAVADGKLWFSGARSPAALSASSPWTQIGVDGASSPDCTVAGAGQSTVHVVALSSAGAVVDVHGSGLSWLVTDLGRSP